MDSYKIWDNDAFDPLSPSMVKILNS